MTSCCSVQEICVNRDADDASICGASRLSSFARALARAVFAVPERVHNHRAVSARLRLEVFARLDQRNPDCE